jgi:hypothetical protein
MGCGFFEIKRPSIVFVCRMDGRDKQKIYTGLRIKVAEKSSGKDFTVTHFRKIMMRIY